MIEQGRVAPAPPRRDPALVLPPSATEVASLTERLDSLAIAVAELPAVPLTVGQTRLVRTHRHRAPAPRRLHEARRILMARTVTRDQLALDETLITDPTLESALEERQAAKIEKGRATKVYKEAHAAAAAEIEKQELPDGRAIRVGRFRITRSTVSARSVAFETSPTSRVSITALDTGDGPDESGVDDEPVRPDPTAMATVRNLASDARSAPTVQM